MLARMRTARAQAWRTARAQLATATIFLGGCAAPPAEPVPGPARQPAPAEVAQPTAIEVRVRVPADPGAPLEVVMEGALDAGTRLRAAATAVGAYKPLRFGAFMRDVSAQDRRGAALAVAATEDGHWRVAPGEPPARIQYRVDAAAGAAGLGDLLVSTHRREEYVVLSGYATYLLVEGGEARPYRVRFEAPEGFRVASPLAREGDALVARSAFELLDEPALLGSRLLSAEVGARAAPPPARTRTPGWVHLASEQQERAAAYLPALAAAYGDATGAVAALGLAPLERPYHVFYELLPRGSAKEIGWALEHGASMQGADEAEEPLAPPRLSYHVAHHLLHAWMPRRLYTDRLNPGRLLRGEGEPSGFIWFAEGFPQYATYVGLARTGAVAPEKLLEMMARRFAAPYLEAAPPEARSMVEHSRILARGEHEHWRYGFASGGLLALWLDETLRARGDGSVGIPEVLARLLERCQMAPGGIPEDSFEAAFAEASGMSVAEIFARHVRGKEPLPVEAILAGAGVAREGAAFRVLAAEAISAEARRFRERALAPRR